MKMYYNNRFTTTLLAITTIGLYALKYSSVGFEIKLFTYLMIFALNLILFITTIVCAFLLFRLRKKLNKEKLNNTIDYILALTDTKICWQYFIISALIVAIALFVCIYEQQKGVDVFSYLDFGSDIITFLGIITIIFQRYINFSIYTYIEKFRKK